MTAEKIVTCCYCGTRAALVLRGRDRHELTCSACGAPLHDLKMLRAAGLFPDEPELEGGPFSAIAYCWTQALEYLPPEERARMQHWFDTEHFPQLMRWDDAYRENLVRSHTCFPVSFSLKAEKPS